MRVSLSSLALVAILAASSLAHICILAPNQRGGYDVSSPGNPTCFQPQAPCGTVPPAEPAVTLRGGTIFYVLIQQNLNHFNIGWPGFIDIAFGRGYNQTSDDEFMDRNAFGDYWPHLQSTQTNFSIPVLVPNANCEHCTLRARYHPNKPTEPIFHNCADIAISYTSDSVALGFSLYAVFRSQGQTSRQLLEEVQTNSALFSIDPVRGTVEEIVAVGERMDVAEYTQAQGLVSTTPTSSSSIAYIGQRSTSNLQNITPNLLVVQSAYGQAEAITLINHSPAIDQWSGFTATGSTLGPYAIVGQIENYDGSFSYSASIISSTGFVYDPVATTPMGEFTFVNIFWTAYNSCTDELYLLAGDENSLYALNVMLYTFDMVNGAVSGVLVDNSQYTISSIHSSDCSSNVYTMSPGLVGTPEDELVWSLITIDTTSGSVVDAMPVTEAGKYNSYYGGGVYGDAICKNQMTHLFQRSLDDVVEGLVIDMTDGSILWSFMPNVGVNNANDIINPVAVCE